MPICVHSRGKQNRFRKLDERVNGPQGGSQSSGAQPPQPLQPPEPLQAGRQAEDVEAEVQAAPPSAISVAQLEEYLATGRGLDLGLLSDEELMRLCQDGDEPAFNILFGRYEGPALSFIYRMVGDRGRTEALGQEAFLRIYRDAQSYQYPRGFSTWFYTIVRNLCKNELRWRARHPTISIEEGLDSSDPGNPASLQLGDNLRSSAADPLEKLVNDELSIRLQKAMQRLPEVEREVLILKCFQGLKYKEIAEIVSISVGIVRSRIHAALDKLRKSVKDYL